MADLITPEIIASLLGDDDADTDVLQVYIDFAVGEIEAYLGRPISVQTFEEDYYVDVDGKIYFQNTPVVSVDSISVRGDVVDGSLYTVTPWGIEDFYHYYPSIIEVDLDDLDRDWSISVTYRAGLDTPAAINSLIASGVIRKWSERGVEMSKTADGSAGLEEIRVEDYALKYAKGDTSSGMYGTGGNTLTVFRSESDFLTIKRYKRRGFA